MPFSPSPPAPPPLPPAPPPAPKRADPAVREARDSQKRAARLRGGLAGTIKTSGRGVTDPAATTATDLLGG